MRNNAYNVSFISKHRERFIFPYVGSGFRIRIFFADPGKNLHADPDTDPGGIRGRGLGVKGKNEFLFEFFHVSDDS